MNPQVQWNVGTIKTLFYTQNRLQNFHLFFLGTSAPDETTPGDSS
jgi:hypothetical protein